MPFKRSSLREFQNSLDIFPTQVVLELPFLKYQPVTAFFPLLKSTKGLKIVRNWKIYFGHNEAYHLKDSKPQNIFHYFKPFPKYSSLKSKNRQTLMGINPALITYAKSS